MLSPFSTSAGHPFDPTFYLSHAVSNVICFVVFGQRFEYEDKQFVFLLDVINKSFRLVTSAPSQMKNFFPGLMRILPGPHQEGPKYMKELINFISQRVQIHRESFDPNCPRDFIDCFLAKMEQEKENPTSEFHNENLAVTVLNLFFAGTETVSTTLRYGLLILLRYPEIEAKVQEEIDRVIGRNRSPSLEDRSQMPFTDAVIHEIQRFVDVSPLAPPHLVTCDTHFRGFSIPKGTTVVPFLSSCLHDPQHFQTPRKFNPQHFLDERGSFRKNEASLPFSTGKRVCLGEGLARMELFLFLTTVLQNFHLKSLQEREEIDISADVRGSSKLPRPYNLCVVPR
uniref:Cytochrome P450 2A10-like n=1 Tax=Podarcis muralis TaxID=64176 RepID=A0A670IQI6_PODMU|nr:cytochrome P450 2A10-like [Podarcis muralis]